ncbi:MAG TPA: 2-oxo acid dehydrogenase subunit E2 [Kofleriaceae bacterium]|nr:2-oxo acid dehydrogenase subunit E2 [Kofleriaceae bacterium]
MPFERFDGKPARGVPAYRRMIPFLMRGKNEAAVYFEQTIDLSKTRPWIEAFNAGSEHRITVFHLLLGGLARVLHERPRLNRFVSGRRLHDRDGVHLSFAAKKRFDDDAPLSVVKRRFEPEQPFADMVADLHADVGAAKSDKQSSVDKEVGLLLRLPAPLLSGAVRLVRALDAVNLAPRALLEHDPMYASAFIANLGSIEIDAAYHHLYEYGNCPLFVTLGRVERLPLVVGDRVEARWAVKLKFTYDERIEDGLYAARSLQRLQRYLEDPATWAD